MKRDEQAGRMILEASTGLHGYVAKDIARAWCELAQRAQELQSRLESLEKDAARYQWIKSKRSLTLETCPQTWIREDGSKYYQSSHYLASDSSLHASMETLDLTIDAAMQS